MLSCALRRRLGFFKVPSTLKGMAAPKPAKVSSSTVISTSTAAATSSGVSGGGGGSSSSKASTMSITIDNNVDHLEHGSGSDRVKLTKSTGSGGHGSSSSSKQSGSSGNERAGASHVTTHNNVYRSVFSVVHSRFDRFLVARTRVCWYIVVIFSSLSLSLCSIRPCFRRSVCLKSSADTPHAVAPKSLVLVDHYTIANLKQEQLHNEVSDFELKFARYELCAFSFSCAESTC
jgi:hypothetical protein